MNRPKPLPSLSSQTMTISGNACHHRRWHRGHSDSIKEGLQTQPATEEVGQEDVMSGLRWGREGRVFQIKGTTYTKA